MFSFINSRVLFSLKDSLEEDMTTHSIILAQRIPWTAEPGGLQSVGLQRVRREGSDLAHTLFLILTKPLLFYTSFTGKEAEAQRSEVSGLRPHS